METSGLEQVRRAPGFHDEPVRGPRQGQRSIRLSRSHRAFYVVDEDDAVEFVRIEEVNKHVYEALMSIRLGEELSQAEFSRQLSISRSHLCDIEKGRKSVSPARAVKWARMLGYSEEQFVRLALQDLVEQAGLDMTVHIEAA